MTKRGFFLLLATLTLPALLTAATMQLPPPMNAQMQWMGRIVVEFNDNLGTISTSTDAAGIASLGNESLDALARQFNVHSIAKLIPWAQPPATPDIRDISRYYVIEFPPDIDLHAVAAAYGDNPHIITAEPYQIHRLDYVPNDPYFSQQWAMSAIHAAQAYDFNRGDTPVVVGIVDSGTDTAHQDLRENLWINYEEDLDHNGIITLMEWNGIDDDQNQYIDDFWGWNFMDGGNNNVQPYNNPGNPQAEAHGTHCAGDASARTDNGLGIGSPGSKAKIMTARAGVNDLIYYGTQGIIYCADNDADVISLSWGSNYYSGYEQSIVNNAWDQGSIVVAAAGNQSTQTMHYPSAYDNVVAVAATASGDQVAGFSNYGTWVDVCAPGNNIYSTYIGTYGNMSGTSMACPITAGLVALIWSADTSLRQNEVLTVLYNTCVNIDNINPSYTGLLGHGRIDAGAALAYMFPNLGMIQAVYDDTVGGNGNGRPDPGETVDLIVTLQNSSTLNPAVGVSLTIACTDPDITIVQGGSTYGNIQPGVTQNNVSNPVRFTVDQLSPVHVTTIDVSIISQSLLFPLEIQLNQMVGRPEVVVVSDDSASNFENWYNLDLDSLQIIHDNWDVFSRGAIPVDELMLYPKAIWHTSNCDAPLTTTEQNVIQYYLNNGGKLFLTGEDIDEQFAGTPFYSDVLRCQSLNAAGSMQLTGVVGNPATEGTTLFLAGGTGANNNQSPNAIAPLGIASLAYTYNSTGQGAGISWNDGPSGLVYFAFNFEAASGLAGTTLRRVVLNNILNWFGTWSPVGPFDPTAPTPSIYELKQNYPNPFNPSTVLHYSLPTSGDVTLTVYDTAGRPVATLVNGYRQGGTYQVTFDGTNLASGIYLAKMEAGGRSLTRKMILMK
jgi:subtilisin family serine protease